MIFLASSGGGNCPLSRPLGSAPGLTQKKYYECGQPFSWVENVDDIAIFIIKKNLQAEIIINAINNTLII